MSKLKSPDQVRIRPPSEQDIRQLVSLENESFDHYYRDHRFNESDFTFYLRDNSAIFLVASTLRVVGYISGVVQRGRSRLSARIDSLAVSPLIRERGVGDQLIKRFLQEARRRQCRSVMLEVAAANENAIRFFAKRGFQKARRLPSYYGERVDGIRMNLDMSAWA